MTTPEQTVLLALCALVAGAVNAIAGGGTLITYPALIAAGVPSVMANATSTFSLLTGQLASVWGFRGVLRRDVRLALLLSLPSVAGAVVGAELLLHIGERSFERVVPWLILGATLLFLLSDRVQPKGRREERDPRLVLLLAVQLAVAVYGGFFGAAQSILMLATLGLCGFSDLDRMNGLKNFAAAAINGVAAALFARGGVIAWRPALVMSLAAIAGGWAGAHLAQRIPKKSARMAVIVIGLATAIATFWKAFL
jgi:uncharacterized membrane protein YfcA